MGCSIDGCEKSVYLLGYCCAHYQRIKRHGSPEKKPRACIPIEEKFWRNVERRGENECWNYKRIKPNGYGKISLGGRGSRQMLAHRFSYQLHYGDLRDWTGVDGAVMHLCDNPSCVNPAHLRLATAQENNVDAINKGRALRRPPRGSKHGNAIITEEVAKYAKESYKSNVELSVELGVHRANIWYIRHKGWRHV